MATQAIQPGAEDEKKKEGTTIGGQPSTVSTGTPTGGGGAPAQAGKGPSSSGSFTDVGKYLKANQPTIGKFAGQVTGGISQQVEQNQADIGAEAAAIREQVEGAAVSAEPFAGQKSTAMDVDQARNVLSGSYGGPKEVALGSLAGFEDAQRKAELGQTWAGRQTLLDETLRPQIGDYSRGERDLDALFLSRDPNAQQALSGLQQQASQAAQAATAEQQALRDLVGSTQQGNETAAAQLGQQLRNEYANLAKGSGYDSARKATFDDAANQEFADLIASMQQNKSFQTWSDPQKALYNQIYNEYLDQGGSQSSGFGGLAGGLNTQDLGTRLASALQDQYDGNLLSGISSEQAAQAQALQELLGGVAGYEDVVGGASELGQRGVYDQSAALDQLMNYWNNLGG